MKSTDADKLLGKLEALLFTSDRSRTLKEISQFLGLKDRESQELIDGLKEGYAKDNRGVSVVEVAGGYRMVTNSIYGEELKRFFTARKRRVRLSQASLEIMAIIAYKQPVTKREINIIRAQECDGTIKRLLEKGLIKIGGRKRAPGRPFFYRTTERFLEYFGLKSLKDLPPLKDKEVQDGLKELPV